MIGSEREGGRSYSKGVKKISILPPKLTHATSIPPYQQYLDACPSHKHSDLEALIKKCKGNETKIRTEIQTWWDAPSAPLEEEWVTKPTKAMMKAKKAVNNENAVRNGVNGRGGERSGAGGRGFRNAPGRGPPQGGECGEEVTTANVYYCIPFSSSPERGRPLNPTTTLTQTARFALPQAADPAPTAVAPAT